MARLITTRRLATTTWMLTSTVILCLGGVLVCVSATNTDVKRCEIGTDIKSAVARLLVEERMHDFGVFDQNQSGSHVFTIRNQGDTGLRIELYDLTCGCTSVTVDEMPLGTSEGPLRSDDEPKLSIDNELHGLAELGKVERAEQLAFLEQLESDMAALSNLLQPAGEALVVPPGGEADVKVSWDTGNDSGSFRQRVTLKTSSGPMS